VNPFTGQMVTGQGHRS